ncbi:hypothetical protein BDQ12DRAFT_662371 [Crucibulum laeve]|uniref:Uncharacterized protein n=1 Tax=Crucibulum laeve TaxID=68775 RepID=A0A5C3MEG1_9AGAR|nr:hypothetical protein BDQ12DRAFT_662371 [Crucibulum laeve]
MCAAHNIRYLNSQLAALWENATDCAKKSGEGLIKPLDHVRYDLALAEFHVGHAGSENTDKMFTAVFDKPRLEFICNHDAVLYLKIRDGYLNCDFSELSSSSFVPCSTRNIKLRDIEIALRMPFDLNGIQGHTSNIGSGAHVIQLLVLDFRSATFVSKVNISGARNALEFYTKKYLDFLHCARHHVLFALPDFDGSSLQPEVVIDYALETHSIHNIDTEIDEIYCVSLADINKSFSLKWFKAVMDVAEDADSSAICLAEYRHTLNSFGNHSAIHVKFGVPIIKALCKREVIWYFKIEDLMVYDGHDFSVAHKHSYCNWQIAVIMDAVKEMEGAVSRVKLDIKCSTTLAFRFCDRLSAFPGLYADVSADYAASIKTALDEFMGYYLATIERAHLNVVHVVNHDILAFQEHDSDPTDVPTSTTFLVDPKRTHDLAKENNPCSFDFYEVISVKSIMDKFETLWQLSQDSNEEYTSCLGRWSHGENFKASFGALKIRFLSYGKAIIWVQLNSGSVTTLKRSNPYDFKDWNIAFKVNFNLTAHSDLSALSKSWLREILESFGWRKLIGRENVTVNHLCLDLGSAKLMYDLSKFEGLCLSDRGAVDYAQTVVHCLKEHYFAKLTLYGHHVLQSLPAWKSQSPARDVTTLNDQVYHNTAHGRHNCHCNHIRRNVEPVVILLGMTNSRPHPSSRLAYIIEWIIGIKNGLSHGTVCHSRKLFLEERLLWLLSRVNASTTIVATSPELVDSAVVPVFADHVDGGWAIVITTWGARKSKKQRKASWKLNRGGESDYIWDYTDKWSYEHGGASDNEANGTYTISCQTKNHLHLPTSFDHGCLDIILRGHVSIECGFTGKSSKSWNEKACNTWSVTLSLTSKPMVNGITVDIRGDTRPKFEKLHDNSSEGVVNWDALDSLFHIDLTELIVELQHTFAGAWEHCFPGIHAYSLCNPVSNAYGDNSFELRHWTPCSQFPVPTIRPRSSLTGKSMHTNSLSKGPKKRKSILGIFGDSLGPGHIRNGPGHDAGKIIQDSDAAIHDGESVEEAQTLMLSNDSDSKASSTSPMAPSFNTLDRISLTERVPSRRRSWFRSIMSPQDSKVHSQRNVPLL